MPFVRLAVAVLVLTAAGNATATSVRRLALDELVARAERVVLARCVAVAPAAPRVGGLPATEVTLAVSATLKGPVADTVVFRQLGGAAAPGPGPRFVVGEEALVFLPRPGALGLTSPVGLAQGKLAVVRLPGHPATVLVDPAPRRLRGAGARATPAPASTGMALDDLLAAVRALAARGAR